MKRSPLARHTPLSPGAGPQRKKRLGGRYPEWSKRVPQGLKSRAPKVAEQLRDRCRGRCEVGHVCGGGGLAEHPHHVLPVSHGGKDELSNLLAVCFGCHRFLHDHPKVSYERGWLRRSTGEQ